MTSPAFTILLPVVRPPVFLPYAVRSVLAQERQDFELFVICDGAPPATVAWAQEFAAADSRIRVFAHPKGERNGERYRHEALQHARGEYVCQIADDDLWLPNHLTEMAKLLQQVDFGNLPQTEILADGTMYPIVGDLADPSTRRRMLETTYNLMGPTAAGYRLSAYRSLAVGWSPAPVGLPSDLHMWRKFLARDDLRFGTRVAVTALRCANGYRRDWSIERREAEIKALAARLDEPAGLDAVVQLGLGNINRRCYDRQVRIQQLAAQTQALKAQLEELDAVGVVGSARVMALRRHVREQANRIQRLREKVRSVKQTWSWRLTRPLRRLARLVRR